MGLNCTSEVRVEAEMGKVVEFPLGRHNKSAPEILRDLADAYESGGVPTFVLVWDKIPEEDYFEMGSNRL